MLLPKKEGEREYYWVRYVKKRIEKKKNFIGIISGPTGSGKSWTGLSFCSMLDKDFNPKRIIFGFKGLMRLINSGEEKLKSGSAILWDEFQLQGGARTWQSLTNKLLNSLLSTFRHKNFILIITSPYQDFLDSQARKLLHAEFNVASIDYTEKKTKLKPYLLQYNSRNKKFYYKYLRISTKLGIAPVKSWSVPKPPKWLIDEYEEMKTHFTTELNKDIERQLDEAEAKKSGTIRKPLTQIQEECMKTMAKLGDAYKVAEMVNLSVKTVWFHLAQSRKKGYNVEEFKEDAPK